MYTSDKKNHLLEMNLGLLKKVRKQERLSYETRYEHSISVPDSISLNHCVTDNTLQHNIIILLSSLMKE